MSAFLTLLNSSFHHGYGCGLEREHASSGHAVSDRVCLPFFLSPFGERPKLQVVNVFEIESEVRLFFLRLSVRFSR